MHLKIHHRTEYRYESPVHYSIQELRITPPSIKGQKVNKWKLHTPIKSTQSSDPFGNICNSFVYESPYNSMLIEAEGEVETEGVHEFFDAKEAVSPFYLYSRRH
jgi:transglutaminase-like putative cysteine protease